MSRATSLQVKPIRSDRDHATALRQIEKLWDNNSADAAATLEVLAVLVDAYERDHHAVPLPDPIEAIEFRMDQLGMSRAALGVILGSRSRATEILDRRRPLTLPMIRKLSEELGIAAEVLIRQ